METNILKTCINYVHLSTYRLRTKNLSSNFLNQIKNIILTWCSQFPFIELQEIYRFRIFPVGLVREADGSGILKILRWSFWIRGRSQTTFTRFGFFWPPTPLRLHFLWYKSLQKVNFFDHLPPSSCKRSLWTAPKNSVSIPEADDFG